MDFIKSGESPRQFNIAILGKNCLKLKGMCTCRGPNGPRARVITLFNATHHKIPEPDKLTQKLYIICNLHYVITHQNHLYALEKYCKSTVIKTVYIYKFKGL